MIRTRRKERNEMERQQAEIITHAFDPVFDEHSKILMLGTMPSPKSRETGFYYGHPRNRFWQVVAAVCREETPRTIEEKTAFLLRRRIALWDVLYSCEIRGADDSSIRKPISNDMNQILKQAEIKKIYTTGTKAFQLYQKHCFPVTGIAAEKLPSTSPANCRTTFEELRQAYSIILKQLDEFRS